MSFEMIAFSLMHFIFALFVSISVYKIFVKYRYNEMIKINLDNMKNIDDSDYICGLDISDLKKAFPVCVCLSVVFLVIQNFIIFSGEPFYVSGGIKTNNLINCLFFIVMYMYPCSIIFYVIRNYKTHGAEYQRFLFWECFMYKGKKLKLFWDDPKYRKNSDLTISKFDVIKQADHEKKWTKICIFVMTAFLMIAPFAESGSAVYFDSNKILISYDKYDYDDITAINYVSAPSLKTKKQNNNSFAAIMFSDGRIYRKYSRTDGDVPLDEFIEFISEKSGIKPVECDALPDLKTLKTAEKSKHDKIISVDTHFKIAQRDSFDYEYSIYDNEGNTVYHENTKGKLPQIDKLSEKLLDIHLSFGSGIIRHLYYDIENDRLSQEFYYVVALKNDIIAYIGEAENENKQNKSLIIQNIYDKDKYCKEINLNLSKEPMPIDNAEFSDDMTQLFIKYRNEAGNKVEENIIIDG